MHKPPYQTLQTALLQASLVFVDISGFPVIKIVPASIDALVEKEVIPEVSEDLSCTKGACGP